MRRGADFFGDEQLPLLYLASRLADALKLEDLLTAAGVDYAVETGTYTGGFLMRRELTGAYFYVAPMDLERARQVLVQNRFKPHRDS